MGAVMLYEVQARALGGRNPGGHQVAAQVTNSEDVSCPARDPAPGTGMPKRARHLPGEVGARIP